MFPTVRCSFNNLRPDKRYWVLLDIVPCDNKRYRYAYHRSSWLVAGKADPAPPHRLYPHPDAPFSGDQLRKQVVSFEKVKLTNNEMDKSGQVRHYFQLLQLKVTLRNIKLVENDLGFLLDNSMPFWIEGLSTSFNHRFWKWWRNHFSREHAWFPLKSMKRIQDT